MRAPCLSRMAASTTCWRLTSCPTSRRRATSSWRRGECSSWGAPWSSTRPTRSRSGRSPTQATSDAGLIVGSASGAPEESYRNGVRGSSTIAAAGSPACLKKVASGSSGCAVLARGSASWTDYSAVAQVKPGTAAAGTSNVLAARYRDDNNSYALILKDGTSWYFGKKVQGAWTTFSMGGFTYNSATWYTLEVDVQG